MLAIGGNPNPTTKYRCNVAPVCKRFPLPLRLKLQPYSKIEMCVLMCFSEKDTWYTTMCRMWPQFMPMPLSDEDSHPCSFSAIFSDPFAASFYSLTWSEVRHCASLVFSLSISIVSVSALLRAYSYLVLAT